MSSIPTRDLVITSDPAITIVRGGQASPIDVLYHGNKIITDVYARQVYLWNAGSDSIRGENILEPVGIVIPGAMILEARIKKFSRPLTKIAAKIDGTGRVMLSWNILEHNDGGEIDVIYAASDASKIEGIGVVEHQSQIRVREYVNARTSRMRGRAGTAVLWVMVLLGAVLVVLVAGIVKALVVPKQPLNTQSKLINYLLAIMAASITAAMLKQVFDFLHADVVPPVF